MNLGCVGSSVRRMVEGLRSMRQDLWSLGQDREATPPASVDRAWERLRGSGLVPGEDESHQDRREALGQGR